MQREEWLAWGTENAYFLIKLKFHERWMNSVETLYKGNIVQNFNQI